MEVTPGQPIKLRAKKTVSEKMPDGARRFKLSNNVKVTQGEGVLTCDQLILIVDETQRAGKSSRKKGAGSRSAGDISMVRLAECLGNVKAVWGEFTATADSLKFNRKDCKVILEGGPPRLWQGSNVIRAEKIILYPCEERYELEGGEMNGIEATITPGTGGKEKK
jgi:lipopolysaccharide export system protein LptA